MWEISGLLGLFLASLLAATLFPGASEAALTALYASGDFSIVSLVVVASVGNTLGSVINWFLGRFIERFRDKKWFPVKPQALSRAQNWYQRYGFWSLLLSWTPFIGDPITVVAGVMREPLWRFVLIVSFAKTMRYTVLAAILIGIWG